ncbi:hypothetical protein B0T19DRAFT_462710 [Cercophora scortea]|uniref:Uncharacterized protein n=1 Tax=Cercophora scortea TaxID=314031 RepID=A0AAE0IED7_9PEZI|nr:hypothetical protein B0T19DRAFT_462710 [Cercophora scortea]
MSNRTYKSRSSWTGGRLNAGDPGCRKCGDHSHTAAYCTAVYCTICKVKHHMTVHCPFNRDPAVLVERLSKDALLEIVRKGLTAQSQDPPMRFDIRREILARSNLGADKKNDLSSSDSVRYPSLAAVKAELEEKGKGVGAPAYGPPATPTKAQPAKTQPAAVGAATRSTRNTKTQTAPKRPAALPQPAGLPPKPLVPFPPTLSSTPSSAGPSAAAANPPAAGLPTTPSTPANPNARPTATGKKGRAKNRKTGGPPPVKQENLEPAETKAAGPATAGVKRKHEEVQEDDDVVFVGAHKKENKPAQRQPEYNIADLDPFHDSDRRYSKLQIDDEDEEPGDYLPVPTAPAPAPLASDDGHKGHQIRTERTIYNSPHGDPTPNVETSWEWSCCGADVNSNSNICRANR